MRSGSGGRRAESRSQRLLSSDNQDENAAKDPHGKYRANDNDVPYNYYRFTVKAGCKKKRILEELEYLGISRETLFPELNESAEAIKREYK